MFATGKLIFIQYFATLPLHFPPNRINKYFLSWCLCSLFDRPICRQPIILPFQPGPNTGQRNQQHQQVFNVDTNNCRCTGKRFLFRHPVFAHKSLGWSMSAWYEQFMAWPSSTSHLCMSAQGYYPLPANLGSIIHWLPTSPGGIWAAWCPGWPSWIWWWWFQTGGIWAEAEVQQHQATKRRWEGGRRPFSTKMSHRFDNHTRVYGL